MNITSVVKHLDEDNVAWYMVIVEGNTVCVPSDPANRHYAEIMRQVEAGELTIQDAN